MRTIFVIVKKEFLQIFRNRAMLPIIFVLPIVQLLILSNAANFDVKNIRIKVVDSDHSTTSRRLVEKFKAFPYFIFEGEDYSQERALEDFKKDKARLILQIPHNFEKDLIVENKAKVQFLINAIDGAAAAVVNVYANSLLRDFNKSIASEWIAHKSFEQPYTININQSLWYNPYMNYKTFMVPGILVLLVTMIGMFLAGMNIVREKEIGTIEQINVTPIKKYQFIIGKLLPFWLLALFELAFGLLIGKIAFDIPIVGSVFLIFLFAAIYLLVVLGLGLFVSTFTNTQQQAMFISWFIMVIFILMSGLFTAIENMPGWAQYITKFNPVAYFVQVMRMVMLKGATLSDIYNQLSIMIIFAFSINSLAILKFRKTIN
mgnify:CR=1 FL=1